MAASLLVWLADSLAASAPGILWQYTLLPGSQITDDCLICGRPSITVPMQGTFRLRLRHEDPLVSSYAVEELSFTAGGAGGPTYLVSGSGSFEIGGEVAVVQSMALEVQIKSEVTNRICYFTNRAGTVDRLWPMLRITMDQTNGLELQTFTLVLNAAPMRDLWFSTASGMTSGRWQYPTNHIGPGDLVSVSGLIVRRNEDLTRNLGIMPTVPDLGLDAVDVASGGEILFSAADGVFSETLGPLQEGDLLSAQGRVMARNQDLTRAFVILPPESDIGLDALQLRGEGEISFSIKTPITTGTGQVLGIGDLLSNDGTIVRSNAQLLARFHPSDTGEDYGLDSFYVWPSGEIWFSTEKGFQDKLLGPVLPGDLLSDQGFIVYRNLELVSAFSPLEDLADFGLDALHVLFGQVPALDIALTRGKVVVSWDTREAVLQQASAVSGPWSDVSSELVPSPYEVPSPATAKFFRLREL